VPFCAEAAIEDDGPGVFAGDAEERIGSGLQLLPVADAEVPGEGDLGGFVGGSAPELAVGHQLAKNDTATLAR